MSNFRIKSKSRVNWSYDKFYMMIRNSYINCKIALVVMHRIKNKINKNMYMKYIHIHFKNKTKFFKYKPIAKNYNFLS